MNYDPNKVDNSSLLSGIGMPGKVDHFASIS